MVTRHSSQTQFIEEYRQHFPRPWNRAVHSLQFKDRFLDVRLSGGLFDIEYVGVFDDNQLIAVMKTLEPVEEVPYRHIGKTIVAPTYKGHRITRQLIEWWV